MVRLLELWVIFLKIGAFTLGGGYAMLSMVERAIVDKKGYMEKQDFWDLIAVVQTLPGVFAINTALYVGYKLRKGWGAFFAALGAALPSFVAILLIAMFFAEFKENEYVERVFMGIRPCVVALILVPAIRLMVNNKMTWKTIWVPLLAALLVWQFKVSPVLIILVVCSLAVLYGMVTFKPEAVEDKGGKEAPK